MIVGSVPCSVLSIGFSENDRGSFKLPQTGAWRAGYRRPAASPCPRERTCLTRHACLQVYSDFSNFSHKVSVTLACSVVLSAGTHWVTGMRSEGRQPTKAQFSSCNTKYRQYVTPCKALIYSFSLAYGCILERIYLCRGTYI